MTGKPRPCIVWGFLEYNALVLVFLNGPGRYDHRTTDDTSEIIHAFLQWPEVRYDFATFFFFGRFFRPANQHHLSSRDTSRSRLNLSCSHCVFVGACTFSIVHPLCFPSSRINLYFLWTEAVCPVTGRGVAVTRIYVQRHRTFRGTPCCVHVHILP